MGAELGGTSVSVVVTVFGVVALGGVVTGVNGFGFAVVGTALLASVLGPQAAVTVMILPILAANVSLVRELDRTGVSTCLRRFWLFLGAALVGTVLGMVSLSRVPAGPLSLALGVLVLLYVALSQRAVSIPGESWVRRRCFVDSDGMKVGLGFVSGVVFGASNVGVQVVAYVRSLELDRDTFVGVLAMMFLGISLVRVGTALSLGLFEGVGLFVVSAFAAVPGLVGVEVGTRVRPRLPTRVQRTATFGLLVLVGVRLTMRGLGLV
jgi:uncharacterized membrane protein YfcA